MRKNTRIGRHLLAGMMSMAFLTGSAGLTAAAARPSLAEQVRLVAVRVAQVTRVVSEAEGHDLMPAPNNVPQSDPVVTVTENESTSTSHVGEETAVWSDGSVDGNDRVPDIDVETAEWSDSDPSSQRPASEPTGGAQSCDDTGVLDENSLASDMVADGPSEQKVPEAFESAHNETTANTETTDTDVSTSTTVVDGTTAGIFDVTVNESPTTVTETTQVETDREHGAGIASITDIHDSVKVPETGSQNQNLFKPKPSDEDTNLPLEHAVANNGSESSRPSFEDSAKALGFLQVADMWVHTDTGMVLSADRLQQVLNDAEKQNGPEQNDQKMNSADELHKWIDLYSSITADKANEEDVRRLVGQEALVLKWVEDDLRKSFSVELVAADGERPDWLYQTDGERPDWLYNMYMRLHETTDSGSADSEEGQNAADSTGSGQQSAPTPGTTQQMVGLARAEHKAISLVFKVMFDVMEVDETFAVDRNGNPTSNAASASSEPGSADDEAQSTAATQTQNRIVGYTLPEAGTPVSTDSTELWKAQMPSEPIATDDLEAWPPEPHEGAKRVNGSFIFEARGYAIDLEDARSSIKGWADEYFGEDADVQFDSEQSTAPVQRISGKPGVQGRIAEGEARSTARKVLMTGDKVRIGSKEGTAGTFSVVVRGDVAQNGTPGLTQLVNVAQAANEDKAASMKEEQLAAADVNGDGKVSVTDCAQQASYMKKPHDEGALYPADPSYSAWESDNRGAHNYINANRWAAPTTSYLFENAGGVVTRVEYVGDTIVVENYDKDLQLLNGRQVPTELEKWGGFFAGKDYNYFVFGQDNKEEDPKREVIRIVQYTKDWKRNGAVSMYGANTQSPFLAGSLRCAEANGYLYVHTCHNMFQEEEGINHQANMMVEVDQKAMKITNAETDVVWGTGLVSHSFNQFVLVDKDGKLVIMDHGDANTRTLALRRYLQPAGQETFVIGDGQTMEVEAANVQKLAGPIGDNDTGCTLGGFAETKDGYITAYGYDGKGGRENPRDIYISFTSDDLNKTKTTRLTKDENPQAPMIASKGLDGGYVLWENGPAGTNTKMQIVQYSADGKTGKKSTADAHLSDCEPISHNGQLLWYTTDKGSPVFYELSDAGVRTVGK